MGLFKSLTGRGSARDKALSLYKQGMARAKKHEHEAAIKDYSNAIALSDELPDVQAMALYNRALVHAADKEHTKAMDDLKAVLALAEIPTNIKTTAREKLRKIERRSNKADS